MAEMRNVYRILLGKLKGYAHLRDLGAAYKIIILKWMLKE
jgi:hypothetical protein